MLAALARLLAARYLLRQLAYLRHREGLRQHPLDARGLLLVRADELAPARDDGERHTPVALADVAQKLPAVHAGHADVCEHRVELARLEAGQRLRAARGRRDLHALVSEYVAQKLAHGLLVVHHKNLRHPASPIRGLLRARARTPARRQPRATHEREDDAEDRAPADLGLDPDSPPVAAYDAVADREPEPGALHALRGEERVEDARAHLRAHPAARVLDGNDDLLVVLQGREREAAAAVHRLHRVEDHVDEHVAQLGRVAEHVRARAVAEREVYLRAGGLGRALPARARYLAHVGEELVNGDRLEVSVLPLPCEVLYALDGLRAVARRLDDKLKPASRLRVRGVLEHQLRPPADDREAVVEVVRDARGERADGRELLDLRELHAYALLLLDVARKLLDVHARLLGLCLGSLDVLEVGLVGEDDDGDDGKDEYH